MPLRSYFRRRRALRDLASPIPAIRKRAVDTLASLGGEDDRLAIEAVLFDHAFPTVQEAAVYALARLAHPALEKVLEPDFFPVNLGTGIDSDHADARSRARLRAACEMMLARLRQP